MIVGGDDILEYSIPLLSKRSIYREGRFLKYEISHNGMILTQNFISVPSKRFPSLFPPSLSSFSISFSFCFVLPCLRYFPCLIQLILFSLYSEKRKRLERANKQVG